jgi:hypothetical protein
MNSDVRWTRTGAEFLIILINALKLLTEFWLMPKDVLSMLTLIRSRIISMFAAIPRREFRLITWDALTIWIRMEFPIIRINVLILPKIFRSIKTGVRWILIWTVCLIIKMVPETLAGAAVDENRCPPVVEVKRWF